MKACIFLLSTNSHNMKHAIASHIGIAMILRFTTCKNKATIDNATFIGDGYFAKAVYARGGDGNVSYYYFEWPDGQRKRLPRIK